MAAAKLVALDPGLYFVATPIGTARDITLRGLDVLASADILAAEDTRSLRRLMDIHGVSLGGRPLLAYHDHNGAAVRPKLLAALADGKSVAYASEAGTPLIADPGFDLGRAAADDGHMVTAAPGASAVLAALTLSGLPTDQFFFAGFAPPTQSARRKFLTQLEAVPATLVFYESPKRVEKMLADLIHVFGPDRAAVIARELTKKFEEVIRGSLSELQAAILDRTLKGEVVLLVEAGKRAEFDPELVEKMLEQTLKDASVKDAVADIVSQTGLPRRKIYQMALKITNNT